MTVLSILAGVLIVAAVIYWLVRAEKREAHHLDGLHISGGDKEQR
jgi:hypothetical protein